MWSREGGCNSTRDYVVPGRKGLMDGESCSASPALEFCGVRAHRATHTDAKSAVPISTAAQSMATTKNSASWVARVMGTDDNSDRVRFSGLRDSPHTCGILGACLARETRSAFLQGASHDPHRKPVRGSLAVALWVCSACRRAGARILTHDALLRGVLSASLSLSTYRGICERPSS